VPVELDVSVDHQKPESAEVAEYYVVAEGAHQRGKPHPDVAGDSVRTIPL
jgi:hypothetical protein